MKITGEFVFVNITIEGVRQVNKLPPKFEITLLDKLSGKNITISGNFVGYSKKMLESAWGDLNSQKLFEKVFQELEF